MKSTCVTSMIAITLTIAVFNWNPILASGSSGESTQNCTVNCQDYHRICPAVNDPSFLAKYQSDLAEGILDASERIPNLPAVVNCSDPFFSYRCPLSCGACVPCEEEKEEEEEEEEEESKEEKKFGQIDVLFATSDDQYSGFGDIESTFNGFVENTASWDCYCSESENDGWAHYTIPFSEVKIVRLVPRHGHDGDQLIVNVCGLGSQCVRCGATSDTVAGGWTESECPSGTYGNVIKLTEKNAQYLQICEIEILGQKFGQIEVLFATSDDQYSGHGDIESTFNGIVENAVSWDCYCSQSENDGWAHYTIPFSEVKIVRLVPRHGRQGDQLIVNVCGLDQLCVRCGATSDTANNGQWTESECPSGTYGNVIKLTEKNAQYLQICEIEILGQKQ